MPEHKTLIFVLAVLYSMDQERRGIGPSESFENVLQNRRGVNLHRAWLKLKREGLLGKFGQDFDYDPLYDVSSFLTKILSEACVSYLLIRLDGTNFAYHLDQVSSDDMRRFLQQGKIPEKQVQKAAARMNELLDEQASIAKSSTGSV
jgi:hypothetical protein